MPRFAFHPKVVFEVQSIRTIQAVQAFLESEIAPALDAEVVSALGAKFTNHSFEKAMMVTARQGIFEVYPKTVFEVDSTAPAAQVALAWTRVSERIRDFVKARFEGQGEVVIKVHRHLPAGSIDE